MGDFIGVSRICASLIVTTLLLSSTSRANGQFAGGTGETNDPYQIATAEQLISIGSDPNLLDKHFVLIADIDLDPNLPGGRVFTQAVIAPAIGNPGNPERLFLTGTFDGQGRTIRNLTIHANGSEWLGLFGEIGEGGRVSNLVLEGVVIRNARRAGALAGWNTGTIDHCSAVGTISGDWMVGGLVGQNGGKISHSHTTVRLRGADKSMDVGGLVGAQMMRGSITGCHAEGSIVVGQKGHGLGGLVGSLENLEGTIANSYAVGDVTAGPENDGLGGLVGTMLLMGGTIRSCYAGGHVSGGDRSANLGGLIGRYSNAELRDCYATGDVTGGKGATSLGGLIGGADAMRVRINNCYAVGKVFSSGLGKFTGGLIGQMGNFPISTNVQACFWDIETTGMPTSAAGTGLTTGKMQDINTYRAAGWDFAGDQADGTDDIWSIPSDGGYPKLAAFSPSQPQRKLSGAGTSEDPYLVAAAQDVSLVGPLQPAYFRLTADLDLSGITWSKAPIPEFEGCFDGGGHRIRNLNIRSGDREYLGFFGQVTGGCVVNLGIESVSITGAENSRNLGGLAGSNSGRIANCYVTGQISAGSKSRSLGGFVGSNHVGIIANCFTEVGISAGSETNSLGGLVAYSYMGTITHCYATGRISAGEGSKYVGGLVGTRSDASDVSRCFWDIDTTGFSVSDGGTGLTTVQLQDLKTFLASGWDFRNERSNGLADVWCMPDDGGYPQLAIFREDRRPHQLAGSGTPGDPFRIADAEDLAAIDRYNGAGCYRLMSDIDLAGIAWTRAPVLALTGVFDGGGFTLSNLTIRGGSYLGLFGILGSRAEVKDTVIQDADILGQDESWYIGILAGENSGRVTNCHVTGRISAGRESRAIGGIAGEIDDGVIAECDAGCTISVGSKGYQVGGIAGFSLSGEISRCHAAATVSGDGDNSCMGGLVGEAHFWTVISDCYAIGSISSNGKGKGLGGLVGIVSEGDLFPTSGKIVHCYAAGRIVAGEDSSDRGGLLGKEARIQPLTGSCCFLLGPESPDNGNGQPLSEEQMKQQASFAGWDFDSVWAIQEGESYPGLQWEENTSGR